MITKEQKVAEVFERYPQAQTVFAQFGFHALFNPLLRKTIGKLTTLERGCRLHRVPLDAFLEALNQAASQPAPSLESSGSSVSTFRPQTKSSESRVVKVILETNVGALVQMHPQVKSVFIKHFGPGCFECPAFGSETVGFACLMHHTDPGVFAQDCLALMGHSEATGDDL